jgi:hypothetical protein
LLIKGPERSTTARSENSKKTNETKNRQRNRRNAKTARDNHHPSAYCPI